MQAVLTLSEKSSEPGRMTPSGYCSAREQYRASLRVEELPPLEISLGVGTK